MNLGKKKKEEKMIPVGPYGDFGSDHPDGKGTFAKRKMARPSTGKPLAAYVSLNPDEI